jgi:two-component system phosphate regulon sensor histidine kinase PhoR
MIAALIGLVVVQTTYIKNTITLKEAQFRYNVNLALVEAAQSLERQDAIERMKQSQASQRAMFQLDSIQRVMTQGWDSDNGYYQKDTVILSEDGGYTMSYTSSMGTGAQTTTQTSVINQVGMQRSTNSIVVDMLSGIMDMNFMRPYEQRLDLRDVDSLVIQSLEKFGIDADHDLAVFNGIGQPVLFENGQGIQSLPSIAESTFSVQLFQNEMFQDPHFLKVHFPAQKSYVLTSLWPLLITSSGLMLIIMGAFAFTIVTIFRQKKIQEIRSDFINNMTHELKTPISTISLACEALADPDMRQMTESRDRFVGMIREENQRLGTLVENVLRTAVIDRGEMRLKLEEVDIHAVIKDSVKNIQLQLEKKDAEIALSLSAIPSVVKADKTHITNVLFNLLDNALKYSPINPRIKISTTVREAGFVIEIKDNGIGISRDNQSKVFENLYRVPTGNTHDVKGFGLGLSYVKAVIEKHGGSISLNSELGKGSTFKINIPIGNENS